MKTFQQLAEILGTKQNRPYGKNTRMIRLCPDRITIRFHQTDVVTFHSDGRVVLNSGGFKTPTTKDRISTHSGINLSQKDGEWSFARGGTTHHFADGVTLRPDGSVSGGATPGQRDAAKDLRKRIAAFAKLCVQKLPLPMPGPGDCLLCQLELSNPAQGTDHLLLHLDEGYVVPSLVGEALESAGCVPGGAGGYWFARAFSPEFKGADDGARVGRMVQKYLLRRFGLA
jgi:hypothetical protein